MKTDNSTAIINQLHEHESRWFAVRTKFKCEKMVQKHLLQKQINCYVPIQQLLRRYQRKVRIVEQPLISCYVFVNIVKSEYIKVLETENVAGFIRFSKNLIAIPEAEMALIHLILNEGIALEAKPSDDLIGEIFVITEGNLAGLKGKLLKIKGKKCLISIPLEHLGYAIDFEMDKALLIKDF